MTLECGFGEAQFIKVLPFLKEWEPEYRAHFVLGMDQLVKILQEHGPMLDGKIAVMVLDGKGAEVGILTKKQCAERARNAKIDQDHIDSILSPAEPGHIDMFLLAGPAVGVIGIPIAFAWVPKPGMQDN